MPARPSTRASERAALALLALLALLSCAGPAGAFQRDLSPLGVPRSFRRVPARPGLRGSVPGVPDAQASAALDRAAGAWSGVSGAWLSFSGPDDGQRPWVRVEVVERRWPHDPAFVAHTDVVDGSPPGAIAGAVISLNAEHHRFCAEGCAGGAVPLGPVLLHELGHAIGLGHSGVRGAVMAPGLGARPSQTAPSGLAEDDRQGVQALYGGAAPADPAPAPRAGAGRLAGALAGAAALAALAYGAWRAKKLKMASVAR